MQQNDAVFQAICEIRGVKGFDEAVELTDKEYEQVVEMVTRGLMSGDVDFKAASRAKHDTYEKVKKYTRGMVKNHLNKDKRLNGDTNYQAKNPGSRTGSQDPVIKNLKLLASKLSDKDQIAKVNEAIKQRQDQLAEEKASKIQVDISKLPEHLRDLVKAS